MNAFVIATEDGIKVEVNENLTKKQIEKTEKFFEEAKKFVNDIDKDVTISLQDRAIVIGTIVPGTILPTITSPEIITESCKILEDIMKKVNNFINDLPNEKEVEEPKDEKRLDAEKVICDACESLKKAIPNAGVFIMVLDPNESGAHLAGDLKKNFVIATLLTNNG